MTIFRHFHILLTAGGAIFISVPGQADTVTDTFQVLVTIEASCDVTAGSPSDVDLGTHPSTDTNVQGNNSLTVNCSPNTPYYIGLLPSNNDTSGAGVMIGSTTDEVPYQLYQDAGTTIWGNTATDTDAGNGYAGTGTGADQSIPVYAIAPSLNFTPGDYADTVTVSVNF
ncbi:spore coat U domain-containing protein [Sphingobium scionense]|uniref:Spore coat protein U-like protein n=1 Tax=Sphingobium scionense TaxID=1404341 RepID=A0A7W6LMM0_9SPHN|nr:spore coat U domain-containing protein [Sphingobium scionense]MBB4147181.1 spore coat protein U-like protein [Sphingobium scionense]